MKVRYSALAARDIVEIADFIRAHSPRGSRAVRAAIQEAVAILAAHPDLGRRLDIEPVRRFVEPAFGYLIYYDLDRDHDELRILRIAHPSRRRLFGDS